MKNTPFLKIYGKVLVPAVILTAVLALTMPRTGDFKYQYRRGSEWSYETLAAPFSFPILKTEEQMDAERKRIGATVVPYFRYEKQIGDNAFSSVSAILKEHGNLSSALLSLAEPVYVKGLLPDKPYDTVRDGMVLSSDMIYVEKGKELVKYPVDDVWRKSQFDASVTAELKQKFPYENVDSILAATDVLSSFKPNLLIDIKTTKSVYDESSNSISPTSGIFRSGDIIVSSGDIITADTEQILDSFKAEYVSTVGYGGKRIWLYLGNLLIAIILTALVIFLMRIVQPALLQTNKELSFVLVIFALANICAYLFSDKSTDLCLLMPFPVFALYCIAFIRRKVVIPLYILCLVPVLLFCPDGDKLFVIFLFAGFAGIAAFNHFNRGWQQFLSAFIIFLSMLFAYLAFIFTKGMDTSNIVREIIFMFLSSLFCVLAYPLVFLFEAIFGLVSTNRLIDLADTNNSLLRELATKAPGTFQHSLSVMNLSEAAARSIDANVPLIRAAALYHDVGKIVNPQCFVENQTAGVNYHEDLSPKESAAEIIRHVSDGLAVAEKHNIPQVLMEFISSHHGTTSTAYFFNQYVNEGGSVDDEAEFSYPGPRPATREQVILMLCDSIEAASRTLKNYSAETVSAFVEKIYTEKISGGQFEAADITLKELDIVKQTIKDQIVQIHHGRIAYPKRRENRSEKKQ